MAASGSKWLVFGMTPNAEFQFHESGSGDNWTQGSRVWFHGFELRISSRLCLRSGGRSARAASHRYRFSFEWFPEFISD
jgi:hypothetical protein